MKRILFFSSLIFTLYADPAFSSASWPNEPAGATLINDWGNDVLAGGGWRDVYNGYTSSIVSDATAPLSPSNVLQQRFAKGLEGGMGGGGGSLLSFPSKYPEIFWGFWMKVDNNYENHPVCTKIGWIHTSLNGAPNGNQLFVTLNGSGPFHINMAYQNADIDNSHVSGYPGVGSVSINSFAGSFAAGQWVRVEMYFKQSSCNTCKDGIWRWWLNGELAGNHTNLNTDRIFPDAVSHITIWGGMGSAKTRAQEAVQSGRQAAENKRRQMESELKEKGV